MNIWGSYNGAVPSDHLAGSDSTPETQKVFEKEILCKAATGITFSSVSKGRDLDGVACSHCATD